MFSLSSIKQKRNQMFKEFILNSVPPQYFADLNKDYYTIWQKSI